MDAVTTSLIVAACVFVGGIAGLGLSRVLPQSHLSKETQDVVRLGTGMLSVLASLVLGLLIATAKSSYDNTDAAIRTYAADLILLDETLRDYGDSALPARRLLRDYTTVLMDSTWPGSQGRLPMQENRPVGTMLEHVREAIRGLQPVDAGQKWLQDQALGVHISLLRQRWLLIERDRRSVRPAILAILVSWVCAIFVSFGVSAPRNATVVTAFLLCSLAIGSAIFLILQLDAPFEGVLRISGEPVATSLAHMLPAGK